VNTIVKTRYRLIRRGTRGGTFYCVDTKTGKRTSLQTANEDEARQLMESRNNADRQPAMNLQIAQDPPRDQTAHRFTPPGLPLHSGNRVSSLRRIEWRDQSAVGFSAPATPNPTPLLSQSGWRTTDTFIDVVSRPGFQDCLRKFSCGLRCR
jgi:hypothetical protein